MLWIIATWGFAAVFLVQAARTPWRPEQAGDAENGSYLYRDGEYHRYRRIRPWGRARFLLLAAANAFVGWLLLRGIT